MKQSLCLGLIAAAVCAAMLTAPAPARAHKVVVFAWTEGNMVHTESKFPNGKMVNGGKILVLDSRGTRLLEGTTDANGLFSFAAPGKADLKIVLEAGMGHKAEWLVRADELCGAPAPGQSASAPAAPAAPPEPSMATAPESLPPPEVQTSALTGANSPGIEKRLEGIERELTGLKRQIAEQSGKEAGFRDILGGIGYLLGLFGAAALVKARTKKGE
jgi:nickel transport protein